MTRLLPLHLHVMIDALTARILGEATSVHRSHYKAALDWATNELQIQEKADPKRAARFGLLLAIPKQNWRSKKKPAKKSRSRHAKQ